MQCESCNSKWESDKKVTDCPFCQAPLASEMPQVAPDSNEAKILQIVKERGPDIYLEKGFTALVMDYFTNDFGRLLKAVIEKKGAEYIFKLKDCPADEVRINYLKILDKLERESFIQKETLAPAVELLCFGLGYSIMPPAPQASPLSDFEIENGKLAKYIGSDSVVVIPNSVTSIGWGAFFNCTSLNQVTIPNSVTSISECAFKGTPWYDNLSEQFNIVGAGVLIKYCGSDSQVTIPNSVTSIGERAFSKCKSLSQVTIPNSVTSIGANAFCECQSLSEVTIPNSVTSIGEYAFSVTYLSEVTIPDSVTYIGEGAFCECYYLSQVTIPNTVTSIGDSAFCVCNSLSQVTIPNSVTSIGDGAFKDCYNLPEDVVQQIEQINPKAFE